MTFFVEHKKKYNFVSSDGNSATVTGKIRTLDECQPQTQLYTKTHSKSSKNNDWEVTDSKKDPILFWNKNIVVPLK